MKRILLAGVIVMIAGLSGAAQSDKDARELTRMLNDFLAGAGKNDAAAHDRFWADDLIYTRSAGLQDDQGRDHEKCSFRSGTKTGRSGNRVYGGGYSDEPVRDDRHRRVQIGIDHDEQRRHPKGR
jgi:hypothetical protein